MVSSRVCCVAAWAVQGPAWGKVGHRPYATEWLRVKFLLFQLQIALAALPPRPPPSLHCPVSVLAVILHWLSHRLVIRNNPMPVPLWGTAGWLSVRGNGEGLLLEESKQAWHGLSSQLWALAPTSTFLSSVVCTLLVWTFLGRRDSLPSSYLLFLAETGFSRKPFFSFCLELCWIFYFPLCAPVRGKCLFLVRGPAWSFLTDHSTRLSWVGRKASRAEVVPGESCCWNLPELFPP